MLEARELRPLMRSVLAVWYASMQQRRGGGIAGMRTRRSFLLGSAVMKQPACLAETGSCEANIFDGTGVRIGCSREPGQRRTKHGH